ncbi:MAG: hypothetical protein RLZ37_1119 [Actinomycetota bacterium]|jgi:leader peptidase (prepilin peptidase)/N-methyltransferase
MDAVVAMRILIAALLGAVCGSFAALVADRIPRSESVVVGRSKCRSCERQLTIVDLIPVVSWMTLRGRCRSCAASFGSSSAVIELLTSGVFVTCAFVIEDPLVLVAHWILCTGLVSLTVIDVATLRLPREIIHATAAIALPVLLIASITADELFRMRTSLIGALCALSAMAVLYVASSGRLGDGDVRLSPLLGAFLGWWSLPAVFSGFFLAFLLGSVIGTAMIISGRSGRSSAIPFGPFLAAGTILTVVLEIDVLA